MVCAGAHCSMSWPFSPALRALPGRPHCYLPPLLASQPRKVTLFSVSLCVASAPEFPFSAVGASCSGFGHLPGGRQTPECRGGRYLPCVCRGHVGRRQEARSQHCLSVRTACLPEVLQLGGRAYAVPDAWNLHCRLISPRGAPQELRRVDSSTGHRKRPAPGRCRRPRWPKQHKRFISQSWRLGVQDGAVSRVGSVRGLSPWLVAGPLLSVSSHGLPSTHV